MNWVKKTAISIGIVLVGIQFIPTTYNVSETVSDTDFIKHFNPPQNIQALFKNACYDCHSNNTHYPWYGRIQPAAMLMESHIKDGKELLNLSDFGSFSDRRKKSKLRNMANQIEDGIMPISSYAFIHRKAHLSNTERQDLVGYINGLRASL